MREQSHFKWRLVAGMSILQSIMVNLNWKMYHDFVFWEFLLFFGIYHALKYILEAIKQNKKRFYLLLFYWPSAIFFDVFNGPEVYSWQALKIFWTHCTVKVEVVCFGLWDKQRMTSDLMSSEGNVFLYVLPLSCSCLWMTAQKGFFFSTRTNILFCKVSTYFG